MTANRLYDLLAVANLSYTFGCTDPSACIWHFRPGTEVEYSSTNFLLGLMHISYCGHISYMAVITNIEFSSTNFLLGLMHIS